MRQFIDDTTHRVEFEKCVHPMVGKEQDLARIKHVIFFYTIKAPNKLFYRLHRIENLRFIVLNSELSYLQLGT